MHLPAQSREFCWRNWVLIPVFRRIHHRQHNHIRRIFNRRLAEKEAACYGENCRVQSDSQSQRENYGGSKSWILAQHASSEAQILPQRLDKRFLAGRADDFLCNFETPPLQAHGAKRILAAHSLLHLFLGCHLEEAAQLFVELPFDTFLSEQRSQSL